jgi:uncharacterized protein YbjQ (UPF0145 family)
MSQPPYQGAPGNYPPQNQSAGYGAPMDRAMITTGIEFSGYKIVRYMGVVRGLTVRSRSVIGNIGAGFQSLVGGKITIYVELCEHAREEAFNLMMQHAAQMGANAIVAMRYDANDVADGITEVLAYGTAVIIQPEKG